ncbi:MAG: 2TM domain-containing protein [Mycobacteriaceae bacterium]
MVSITLDDYEKAEHQFRMRQERTGLIVHAVVTVLVWAVLIPINVFVAPQFPWAIFVVAGMGIALFFHWFGYRHADDDIQRQQKEIEERARAAMTS